MGSGKSREETIRESMSAPKKIDTNVFIKIQYSSQQFDPSKHKYKCSCCEKGFNTQKSNFHKTNSPLFQANDGYLPWCCECEDKYLIQLTSLFCGNEEHAIEFYCHLADWVYDFEVLKQAREISSDRSRISHYSAKKNLNVGGRKTYIDTLKFAYKNKQSEIIQSKEHHEQLKSNGEANSSAASIERWGAGFPDPDYKLLDDHYKMLKKYNPNCDNNQEIFIKDLCYTKLLQMKSMREGGKSDDFDKFTKLYRDTFKQAGLKTVEEKDSSSDEAFGVTLATISLYTPEEYYLNKQLYEDYDEIGDYIERHMCRPLKNLQTGSTDRDFEFFVPDTEVEIDEDEE